MATKTATARSHQDEADTRWHVQVLGGFSVTGRNGTVHLPESTWRLVGLLALALAPVGRSQVAGTIWGERDQAHAQGCLRSTLWRLSRSAPGLVSSEGHELQLAGDVGVDLAELRDLAMCLEQGAALDPLAIDPRLCCYELLPDWYDEFVECRRELVRQLRLRTLEALARRLHEQQQWGSALRLALTAVAEAPLRETTHQLILEIHAAEGNVSEAVRHYRALRTALRRELGVAPSKRLRETIAPFLE